MQLRPHSIRILSSCGSRASSSLAALSLLGTITVLHGMTMALGSVVQQARYTMLMWVDPEGREATMCQERSRVSGEVLLYCRFCVLYVINADEGYYYGTSISSTIRFPRSPKGISLCGKGRAGARWRRKARGSAQHPIIRISHQYRYESSGGGTFL
ncbi:hypothetical protein M441DRAFT_321046 [Trichoderma asperellum CBS 433.97]|uniref:Uncharacterized protein n=1 Tax=Trichoderma asperellum (strain ATCC 204424 / CBS 433.97 / NBRC 101777) TaxID=1042311 RepID=A0A2T3ZLA5_TRIA4|nr:hypothetical protein M441DRAFT_321046 [Trichoderma asperellum CBS 433.97]PTB45581.1 hypothetical protein M441DRAFT_321046 [Trichoderma asperellum CBS 433.97]